MTSLARIGADLLCFETQQRLNLPLILYRKAAISAILKEFSVTYNSEANDILFIRGHSKAYRPKKDGRRFLQVTFEVYRSEKGVSHETLLLPHLSRTSVSKARFHPHTKRLIQDVFDRLF